MKYMQYKSVYQIKITLLGSKPVIWRRILVPNTYSFFDLHVAIQSAMGWEDAHLHQYFTKSPYGRSRDYERIHFPMPEMDDFEKEAYDERKIRISKYLLNPKDTVFYEYDFGDSWAHEIKLEKILPTEAKLKYPVLLDGENACPPEDCGGIGGYYGLLEALYDPKNPEHKDMMEWMGLDDIFEFDPKEFNKKTVKFRDSGKVLKIYEKQFGVI